MNEIINQLANQDLMPSADVLEDFYQSEKIEASLSDVWEPVPEHELANLDVPGHTDICPLKAWKVITQHAGTWMVYNWYQPVPDEIEEEDVDGQDAHKYTYSGWEDEIWLYARIPENI